MIVKRHNTIDVYDKIVKWWEGNSFPPLSIKFLPESCFIVTDNDLELYAIFLYYTDSGLCWMGFPVVNPDTKKEERGEGLKILIEGVTEYAKQIGFNYVFTTSPLKKVQDCFTENGYVLGDENVNHYIKIL